MSDIRDVAESVAALSSAEKQEKWFPSYLSKNPTLRLNQRQIAQRAFVFEAIKTRDEHEQEGAPLKPLPQVPHVGLWLDAMLAERILLAPKSRQIFMTWTSQCGLTYRILERPSVNIAYVTKKLEDGVRHVEGRVKGTIWESLPTFIKEQYRVAEHKGALHLTHKKVGGKWKEWNSRILAFPQGADQLRSEVFTIVFWDEMAFCCDEESWKAVIPTIMQRGDTFGQLIGISSVRRGSYFNRALVEPWNFRRARNVARLGTQEAV